MRQPRASSSHANGRALTICPSCPDSPTNWVTIGTRRGGNQDGSSRMTEEKTKASPAPRIIRPGMAMVTESANAMTICPMPIVANPSVSIRREP